MGCYNSTPHLGGSGADHEVISVASYARVG